MHSCARRSSSGAYGWPTRSGNSVLARRRRFSGTACLTWIKLKLQHVRFLWIYLVYIIRFLYIRRYAFFWGGPDTFLEMSLMQYFKQGMYIWILVMNLMHISNRACIHASEFLVQCTFLEMDLMHISNRACVDASEFLVQWSPWVRSSCSQA